MLHYKHLLSCAASALVLVASHVAAADEPSHDAFTYQGQLRQGGDPVVGPVNLKFRLYNAETAGDQVGPELSVDGFDDFDDAGRFTLDLPFGKSVFDGTALWLEIQVGTTVLAPRQPVMPTPYAVRALTIAPTAAPFLFSGPHAIFTGGNVGIGTSSPTAPLHVSSSDGLAVIMPGLRLFQQSASPIVIGGYSGNFVTGGMVGATIAGGGINANVNRVEASFGTIGGGVGNWASGQGSTVAGGGSCRATGNWSNVGGGFTCIAEGLASVCDGGWFNTATGQYSTVAGGAFCNAAANRSFAAGYRAKANHDGAFVWADSTDVDVASTAANQFLIRASGGVQLTTGDGTVPFLGAVGNQPLEFKVNGQRALRLEPHATSPNVIGGFSGNQVSVGVNGATIGGGGTSSSVNSVTSPRATIGGGMGHTAGGLYATIGGGSGNTTSGPSCTIAGGSDNTAGGTGATIGGGTVNSVSGAGATVAGGWLNVAGGDLATVPGGQSNSAAGTFSFAAGYRAKANHAGTFVWGDSTESDVASTAANQFLIRASGNVGINTTSPGSSLQVNGGIRARGGPPGALGVNNNGYSFFGNGGDNDAGMFSSADGQIEFHTNGQEWMRITSVGRVGINTTTPGSFQLAVNGDAAKPGGGSWSVFSDARLKRSITPMTAEGGTLDRLLALHGYTFEYRDEAIEHRLGLPGRQTGLLAQEVAEVFPDWVGADEDGYLFVTERGLTAILVESLRELRAEKDAQLAQRDAAIKALRSETDREIASLRSENAELQGRLDQLEAQVQSISASRSRTR